MNSMKQQLWTQFDPQKYLKNNYIQLHEEDKRIITLLAAFYQKVPRLKLACEIGVGPNLYPLMAALPVTKKIEAIDYTTNNLLYLRKQKIHIDAFWNIYWKLFQKESNRYYVDLKTNFQSKTIIRKGNIYSLPKERFDLSSMHFCAESITADKNQFVNACHRFIFSVKHNGYLVASFMENSKNYYVESTLFPSFPINKRILKQVFEPYTTNLVIHRIHKAKKALRQGYTGMLLLTAQRK